MSNDLHKLVYYSRNRMVADDTELRDAVQQILATSQENNLQAGVTGALMFNSGCFAQILEGPMDALEETFERIQQDERHGDVSLLAFQPTTTRTFENWSMAFVGSSLDDAARFADVARATAFDPSRMDGDRIHQILRDLTIAEENAAV
ncbi:MAG: BLUF domain-containing protein [Aurantimonas coralicida]|uniref:BLUF domain-containing protein n=1 Tax=Alphaproteobacteria TaxID=28211 RepID=UPI00041637F2|nr:MULTISPECIES: BLUF domain-containing protein [Aurantimonas]MBC6718691.1 BLUF domain-containing protein [Aurantimonas sp. DM33-3]|tara:strand:- start:66 stop:509 length:444 start_codon:yes stop_codon:yes gene_type:complete